MQDTTAIAQTPPLALRVRARRRQSRLWTVVGLFVLLLSLALFPPLLSLGRYQRRIAQSISLSLGRPVHLDRVTLNLLPLPSLSIQNFVIDEDPAFGEEPIVRAHTVVANLRVTSLWRRRIEISSMRFLDPSVNLVLRADGHWNLQDVLLQASRIEAAPTAQRNAGRAPRFPYIEATGARLNLKLGVVKTPFSLTEADFALFLAEPQQWRMRLKAKPTRTDISVSDTGTVEAEATLHRAAGLDQVPITLQGTWRNAPLGETSRILFGRDLGVRGSMRLAVESKGTVGRNALTTRLELLGLHRSDFVPADPLQVLLDCTAEAHNAYRDLKRVNCGWPVPDAKGAVVAVTGSIPDVLHLSSADLQAGTGRLPMPVLLQWARVFSARIAPGVALGGELSASLAHRAGDPPALWSGRATMSDLTLRLPGDERPSPLGDVVLTAAGDAPVPFERPAPVFLPIVAHPSRQGTFGTEPGRSSRIRLDPVAIPLGASSPALLEGQADGGGYSLHLSGAAETDRLEHLLTGVPPLADGLSAILWQRSSAAPVHLDLSATRAWGGPQVWTDNLLHPPSVSIVRRPLRHH